MTDFRLSWPHDTQKFCLRPCAQELIFYRFPTIFRLTSRLIPRTVSEKIYYHYGAFEAGLERKVLKSGALSLWVSHDVFSDKFGFSTHSDTYCGTNRLTQCCSVNYLLVWRLRSHWSWICTCRHWGICYRWAYPARGSRTPPWWGCRRPARLRTVSGTGRWADPGTRAQKASRGGSACSGGTSCAPGAPSYWPAASPRPGSHGPAGWAAASARSPRYDRAAGPPGCPRTGAVWSSSARCCMLSPASRQSRRTLTRRTLTWAPLSPRAGSSSRTVHSSTSSFSLCKKKNWVRKGKIQHVIKYFRITRKARKQSWAGVVERVECLVWVKSTVALLWLQHSSWCVWLLREFGEVTALCLCAVWKQEAIVKSALANRSAPKPFGTVLSVKALNYPVCKKLPRSLPEPSFYSPTFTSFDKTKHRIESRRLYVWTRALSSYMRIIVRYGEFCSWSVVHWTSRVSEDDGGKLTCNVRKS